MSEALRLLPNFGAEEGEEAADARFPALDLAVADCWHGLFAAGTRWLDDRPIEDSQNAGTAPTAAVYPWLEAPGRVTAWLNTEAARERAIEAGTSLTGAAPEIVRRVHDKAFAQAVARSEDLLPGELVNAICVFDPQVLRDSDAAVAAVANALADWPEPLRRRFTLKPRFGTSGRGRVAGVDGIADSPALRGAFPRLAERGGAILEPWCDRTEDLSASLFLAETGELTLLGTTRQWLTPAGVYRGQRGSFDSRARVTSGSDHDEPLREAAATVARAAAEAGYFGPCGLDAFAYRTAAGSVAFRPAVEWNARFTMGIVAIGWLKRLRAEVVRAFDLDAEDRLAFHFGIAPPPGGWPPSDASLTVIPLGPGAEDSGAALAFARDPQTLDRVLGESPG